MLEQPEEHKDATASHNSEPPPVLDPMDPGFPVLDPEVIGGLRALRAYQKPEEQDIVTELITLFLTEVPQRLAAMRKMVADDDLPELERLAHSMKGSCEHMGARRMASACAMLEKQANQRSVEHAHELLSRIEQEYSIVSPLLQAARRL